MNEVNKSKLRLNRKTISVLSSVQQMQVKGGDKAPISSFHSAWACDTISCCSVPFCSVIACEYPE